MSIIVTDVETTGLVPGKNVIVSIGAVDFLTGEEFYGECRIYPDSVVDQQALAVNGFTMEQITDPSKPLPHELYSKFSKWASELQQVDSVKRILAGQQIGSFDAQFLQVLCKNANEKWPFGHRSVDLHSIAYGMFRESSTVDEILVIVGLQEEPKPHNALVGARLERDAFKKLFDVIDKMYVAAIDKYKLN